MVVVYFLLEFDFVVYLMKIKGVNLYVWDEWWGMLVVVKVKRFFLYKYDGMMVL